MRGSQTRSYPRRRAIRLRGYDYTQQGAYFVTICTWGRLCALGDVVDSEMVLSDAGQLAQAAWQALPQHYPGVRLDAWVIMPNHVHGIIVLEAGQRAGLKPAPTDDVRPAAGRTPARSDGARAGQRAGLKPAPTRLSPDPKPALSELVRAFKTFSARRINTARNTVGSPFWQRNYYEHVIRDDDTLNRIRQYIVDNPAKWHEDPENPDAGG